MLYGISGVKQGEIADDDFDVLFDLIQAGLVEKVGK